MRRAVLVILFFSFSLFGQDFRTFEKEALSHALELKIEALRQHMQDIETKLPLFDKQMELELFGAQYKESAYRSGGSVGIKIPVLLNQKELRAIAAAQHEKGKLLVRYAKAKYRKELELLFTDYVFRTKKARIAKHNEALTQKIAKTVQKLFTRGAARKQDLVHTQALVAEAKKEALLALRKQERARMALEGFTQMQVDLEARFLYKDFDEKRGVGSLPFLIQDLAAKQAFYQRKSAAKKVRRIDFVLEYEKEPDQDIYRAGVVIPLTNMQMVRQQERLALMQERAAKLQLQKSRYALATHLQGLIDEAKLLQRELAEAHKLVAKAQEAWDLSLRALRLRAATMTEILQARRSLLQARKSVLETDYELQKRIIQIRFIQGAYDD